MMLILISLLRVDCISPEIFVIPQGTNFATVTGSTTTASKFSNGAERWAIQDRHAGLAFDMLILSFPRRVTQSTFWAVFTSKMS